MKLKPDEVRVLSELLEQVYESVFLAGATPSRGRIDLNIRLNLPEQYRIQDLLKRVRAQNMTQHIIDKNSQLLLEASSSSIF